MSKVINNMLTPREVAEHFGIKHNQVLRMIKEGRLKAQKIGGWNWFIREDDLPVSWPPPPSSLLN